MNKLTFLIPLILAAILFPSIISARVLLIVDSHYYSIDSTRIIQYANDIQQIDGKTVTVDKWTPSTGTNVQQCKLLWSYLESQYSLGLSNHDLLEGAVLIGNIPVPQYYSGSSLFPFDYYYMDIWDSRSNAEYPNHDMTPFNTDAVNTGYFLAKYNVGSGDGLIDIWVSRIYSHFLGINKHLRSSAPGGNASTILDTNTIINEYLDRLHNRYTNSALVPSRGFAMGGTADMIDSLQDALSMQLLNLPMYVEFNSGSFKNTGEANPFNLMSQLQVGPAGGTTYGAYNGTVFPNQRNARNCKYTQLTDARSYSPYSNRAYSSLDSNGWEWAGIFSHSSNYQFSFDYSSDNGPRNNGSFSSGTYGPFWVTA